MVWNTEIAQILPGALRGPNSTYSSIWKKHLGLRKKTNSLFSGPYGGSKIGNFSFWAFMVIIYFLELIFKAVRRKIFITLSILRFWVWQTIFLSIQLTITKVKRNLPLMKKKDWIQDLRKQSLILLILWIILICPIQKWLTLPCLGIWTVVLSLFKSKISVKFIYH